MKKCSVIVPIYKGKPYIEKCIQSVIAQTYTCWELILMDDGSPDYTYDFVKKIVDKYPTYDIKLFRQENRGVAETRNYCVTLATGEYIAFIDQDDTVDTEYLKKLVSEADTTDCDIAMCGYVRKRNDGKIIKTVRLSNSSFSKYRIVAPWARIYKKSFLIENSLKFLSTSCGEDTFLNIKAYALTPKTCIIEGYTGYIWHYNQNSVSNTHQKSIKTADTACATFEKIISELPEQRCSKPEDEEYFFIKACLFYLLFSSHSESKSDVDYAYNRYFDFLNNNFPNYEKNPLIGIFSPKCESFSVRFTVWAFMVLKRLRLARTFVHLWCKIH